MNKTKSMVICGVGGQGTILTTEVVSEALFQSGFDVKKNEIHGMSQRGGSVVGFVRYGEKVYSPMLGTNDADFLISFEKLEALRYLSYLNSKGTAIVSDVNIEPIPVMLDQMKYPDGIEEKLQKKVSDVRWVDAMFLSRELGNLKVVNIILTGVLSNLIPEVKEETWKEAIRKMVKPKFVEINLKAFDRGRGLHVS